MSYTFHDNPKATTAELQQELKRLVEQLNRKETGKRLAVTVTGNVIFPVAHGQRFVPATFTFTPHGFTTFWYRAAAADKNCVYIFSDATVTGDFVFHPPE